MILKNHPIVIYIDRNSLAVYQDVLHDIPRFNFTQDLVVNSDVVNKEKLMGLIGTFIKLFKMVPSSLVIILSDDVIYVKDFTDAFKEPSSGALKENTDYVQDRDQVQNFLENVPFENVLAKVIKAKGVNRAVAVNKDLIRVITNAFANKGSVVEAVIPGFLYGQSAKLASGLNAVNARIILENVEVLKLGNLLTNQDEMSSLQTSESEIGLTMHEQTKKPRNIRQFILIGAFVFLLIVLIIVFAYSNKPQNLPKDSAVEKIPANSVDIISITPTVAVATESAKPIDIKIKIIQTSASDEKSIKLKNELLKIGIQDFSSEILEISVPEKSSAIFSQDIPADLRDRIIAEIKKVLPDISILESQDSGFTVDITVGKS